MQQVSYHKIFISLAFHLLLQGATPSRVSPHEPSHSHGLLHLCHTLVGITPRAYFTCWVVTCMEVAPWPVRPPVPNFSACSRGHFHTCLVKKSFYSSTFLSNPEKSLQICFSSCTNATNGNSTALNISQSISRRDNIFENTSKICFLKAMFAR